MVVEARDAVTRLRLPETGLVLGIRYRGAACLLETGGGERRLPDRSLAGMTDTARRMRTSADGGVVLARFRPGGAARFFAEPLNEIFGTTVALDELVRRRDLERVQGQVADAANDAERAAALEAFLTARLRPLPPDPDRRRGRPRAGREPRRAADLHPRPPAGGQPRPAREALPSRRRRDAQAARQAPAPPARPRCLASWRQPHPSGGGRRLLRSVALQPRSTHRHRPDPGPAPTDCSRQLLMGHRKNAAARTHCDGPDTPSLTWLPSPTPGPTSSGRDG